MFSVPSFTLLPPQPQSFFTLTHHSSVLCPPSHYCPHIGVLCPNHISAPLYMTAPTQWCSPSHFSLTTVSSDPLHTPPAHHYHHSHCSDLLCPFTVLLTQRRAGGCTVLSCKQEPAFQPSFGPLSFSGEWRASGWGYTVLNAMVGVGVAGDNFLFNKLMIGC